MSNSGAGVPGRPYQQSTSHYNLSEDLPSHSQHSVPQYHRASAGAGSNLSSSNVPTSLQPGSHNRPHMLSTNTAPGQLPTMPQLSLQVQQTPQSMRSGSMNHSHSYSRSSPGGMAQPRYKSLTTTPDASKLPSPLPTFASQTPQGPTFSPLGLDDIRPKPEPGLSDDLQSPTIKSETEDQQHLSNSHYMAHWPIYAIDWCKWPPRQSNASAGKIALGSYMEDGHNYIQILDAHYAQPDPEAPYNDISLRFTKTAEATHTYPVTRILWEPPSSHKSTTDLLATSGDHLRLWSLPSEDQSHASSSLGASSNLQKPQLQKLSPLALLSNSKSPEHTAPITSLDWNVISPSLIITSSIDTTCTIWDIPSLTAKTQLIAHDKEVFDVRFCAQSVDVFVSCGADGSVRMFDLRSLEHSTIIYEPSEKTDKNATTLNSPIPPSPSTPGGGPSSTSTPQSNPNNIPFPPPLLRIAASPHDAHLLATISTDSPIIRVLDVRQPGQALLELRGHSAAVNCLDWNPNSRGTLASGGDDSLVLIWDMMSQASASATAALPGSAGGATTIAGGGGGGIGNVGGSGANSSGGGSTTTGATISTNNNNNNNNSSSGNGSGGGGGGGGGNNSSSERGPAAIWSCDYEVNNLSWAPVGDTLGACGGRGLWGVQM